MGIYSNHVQDGEEFTCARCGVFDEALALDQIRCLRKALADAKSPERIEDTFSRSSFGTDEAAAARESADPELVRLTREMFDIVSARKAALSHLAQMKCDGCARALTEPGCQYRDGFYGIKVHLVLPVRAND